MADVKQYNKAELEKMTFPQILAIVRERKYRGHSGLRKPAMIDFLLESQARARASVNMREKISAVEKAREAIKRITGRELGPKKSPADQYRDYYRSLTSAKNKNALNVRRRYYLQKGYSGDDAMLIAIGAKKASEAKIVEKPKSVEVKIESVPALPPQAPGGPKEKPDRRGGRPAARPQDVPQEVEKPRRPMSRITRGAVEEFEQPRGRIIDTDRMFELEEQRARQRRLQDALQYFGMMDDDYFDRPYDEVVSFPTHEELMESREPSSYSRDRKRREEIMAILGKYV